ncbi:MAG: hypothetical protein M3Z75_02460 [Actinomycetota bacterium]|nr:hypothetical protein [Actinomycetota bacterium]
MQPFRFTQRCRPGFPLGLSAPTSVQVATGRLGRWLGICLIAIVAGWPAVLAASGAAGPSASGAAYVLTAFGASQARVLNRARPPA